MHADRIINRLDRFRHAVVPLGEWIHPDEATWKPGERDWSIVEILAHMVDIETQDMRTRLRLTLEDPEADWPGIDPEGWAIERNYAERDLKDLVERFLKERTLSVDWLRSLRDPDWRAAHTHPKLGAMRAGDILCAWCAHDSLHWRQISKRLYQMTREDGGAFSPDYAGQWKA